MTAMRPLLRPRFISIDEAIAWHELGILTHGGSLGLRDRGALESALAQPQQAFGGAFAHEFPFEMASAYAFHLAKNHPFVDGNKRIALTCCGAFLRMNGWNLAAAGEAAADAVVDLVTGKLDKSSFAKWLVENCRERPSLELRDFLASLNYTQLASTFESIAASGRTPETVKTYLEAGKAVPAVAAAQIGALHAEEGGDTESATLLRQQALFLTALYRIAEDMGYEW